MKKSRKKREPSVFRIACKFLVCLLLIALLYYEAVFTIAFVVENNYDQRDMANKIQMCDEYYYKKQYGKLKESLELYELYDDHFDVYWEAVKGNSDYLQYLQWSKTDPSIVKDSAARAESYRQKVQDNGENCRFEKNQKQLDWYMERIQ